MTKDEIIRLSAKGGKLPPDLNPADTFLFLSARALYSHARASGMKPEDGAVEKSDIIRQYENLKLWLRIVDEHMRKEREFERQWEAFAKNPTLENANALHKAWTKGELKIHSKTADEERRKAWGGEQDATKDASTKR